MLILILYYIIYIYIPVPLPTHSFPTRASDPGIPGKSPHRSQNASTTVRLFNQSQCYNMSNKTYFGFYGPRLNYIESHPIPTPLSCERPKNQRR